MAASMPERFGVRPLDVVSEHATLAELIAANMHELRMALRSLRISAVLRACAAWLARTDTGRGSLRPPAASRCSARKLAARSFPRRPPAAWSWRKLATARISPAAQREARVALTTDAVQDQSDPDGAVQQGRG